MKMKNLSSILNEAAALCEAVGTTVTAEGLRHFVKQVKPFEKLEALGLFKFNFLTGAVDASGIVGRSSTMSARELSNVVEATAALLKAAGSSAKSKDLALIASEIRAHDGMSIDALIDGVHEEQRRAMTARAEQFVRRLTDSQQNDAAFSSLLSELKKENADIANAVAVQYVQGKSKYPSKPKALAAIADKRFERVRLAAKMAQ